MLIICPSREVFTAYQTAPGQIASSVALIYVLGCQRLDWEALQLMKRFPVVTSKWYTAIFFFRSLSLFWGGWGYAMHAANSRSFVFLPSASGNFCGPGTKDFYYPYLMWLSGRLFLYFLPSFFFFFFFITVLSKQYWKKEMRNDPVIHELELGLNIFYLIESSSTYPDTPAKSY